MSIPYDDRIMIINTAKMAGLPRSTVVDFLDSPGAAKIYHNEGPGYLVLRILSAWEGSTEQEETLRAKACDYFTAQLFPHGGNDQFSEEEDQKLTEDILREVQQKDVIQRPILEVQLQEPIQEKKISTDKVTSRCAVVSHLEDFLGETDTKNLATAILTNNQDQLDTEVPLREDNLHNPEPLKVSVETQELLSFYCVMHSLTVLYRNDPLHTSIKDAFLTVMKPVIGVRDKPPDKIAKKTVLQAFCTCIYRVLKIQRRPIFEIRNLIREFLMDEIGMILLFEVLIKRFETKFEFDNIEFILGTSNEFESCDPSGKNT